MAQSITNIKGGGDAQAGAQKQVKIKLTKEQKLYVDNMVLLEERIKVCRDFITLWSQFFRFFAEDLSQKEITPDEEKAFFQIMTQVARRQFIFVESMSDFFDRGPVIIDVLCSAVSLANIQVMPENTRSKLELDWHGLYLDMNKALGRLLRTLPGNMSLSEALEYVSKLPSGGKVVGKVSEKSKALAALLAFPPMGCLGLDCFYLNDTKKGILRLVTLGGVGLWALFDCIMILSGKGVDGQKRPLV